MENLSTQMIEKLKGAKAPEELLEMLKEAGAELSEEEAKMYYEHLNAKSGELSDDELDNVSGGGCRTKSGRTIVTNHCKCFTGMWEDNLITSPDDYIRTTSRYYVNDNEFLRDIWYVNKSNRCGSCKWLAFEGGTGVCSKS